MIFVAAAVCLCGALSLSLLGELGCSSCQGAARSQKHVDVNGCRAHACQYRDGSLYRRRCRGHHLGVGHVQGELHLHGLSKVSLSRRLDLRDCLFGHRRIQGVNAATNPFARHISALPVTQNHSRSGHHLNNRNLAALVSFAVPFTSPPQVSLSDSQFSLVLTTRR